MLNTCPVSKAASQNKLFIREGNSKLKPAVLYCFQRSADFPIGLRMDAVSAGLKKTFGTVLDRESAWREKRVEIVIRKLRIKQDAENLFMVKNFASM